MFVNTPVPYSPSDFYRCLLSPPPHLLVLSVSFVLISSLLSSPFFPSLLFHVFCRHLLFLSLKHTVHLICPSLPSFPSCSLLTSPFVYSQLLCFISFPSSSSLSFYFLLVPKINFLFSLSGMNRSSRLNSVDLKWIWRLFYSFIEPQFRCAQSSCESTLN